MMSTEWQTSRESEKLRDEISEYVKDVIQGEIPRISFRGYKKFMSEGSRKESEEDYFQVRKQLAALGLYLCWDKNQKAIEYFNELLWSVGNEFSWCLASHLSYGEAGFGEDSDKNIDLFAAETAESLSELLILHKDIIDPFIWSFLREQINKRVLQPFMEKTWGWETSINNWCAVCSGSIGIAAILLEEGKVRVKILDKVDKALEYYLRCFREDGATEEGIGYWVYGFGYYIYYTALRQERDADYRVSAERKNFIRKIAEYPYILQISEKVFLPFSDADAETGIPTGLLSYLQEVYDARRPVCFEITSFHFDHCYRFAHLGRNLWWTKKEIFHGKGSNITTYFKNLQWLIHRNDSVFFAVKGGHNKEEHNHNDVGNFILALEGELILTDLGAGPYTADYFGEKRYQYTHTRSHWHNVPLVDGREQAVTDTICQVTEVKLTDAIAGITLEYGGIYDMLDLYKLERKIEHNREEKKLTLWDSYEAGKKIEFEESFISTIKPAAGEGKILWKGSKGEAALWFDSEVMDYAMEEKDIKDHLGNALKAYRAGVKLKKPAQSFTVRIDFQYELYNHQ